ncbi:transmembrane protease serine 11D [Procambarus clarkii]|uniref:transmembrane protease serine 11D n=1 Tax=Procambarus clarkii TaxID=6728 RepID=UPI001E673241|nr:transmembrane protease serine 9-like [Procambarus clarkii]
MDGFCLYLTGDGSVCPVSRLYCAGCGEANIVVPDSKIVNGSDASPGEFPYQVHLTPIIDGEKYGCGGSIIKKRWILTAAHCFFDDAGNRATRVTVGVGSIFTEGLTQVTTKQFITHQAYDPTTFANDIALVELATDLPFDTNPDVQPICLGQESDIPYGGRVVVSGWGALASGDTLFPNVLHKVQLNVITIGECRALTTLPPDPTKEMCTLTPYKDACQGDSGGALVAQVCPGRWVQVGIVSYGKGCGEPRQPGVYLRVTAYVGWITQTTGSRTC